MKVKLYCVSDEMQAEEAALAGGEVATPWESCSVLWMMPDNIKSLSPDNPGFLL